MRRPFLFGVVITFILFLAGGTLVASAGGKHERVHRVTIANFKFDPATLDVRKGDVVIWTNKDFVAHTATADDSTFDTGKLDAGASKRVVAAKKGTFPAAEHHSGTVLAYCRFFRLAEERLGGCSPGGAGYQYTSPGRQSTCLQ